MSSNDDLFPPAYGYLYAVANPTWSGLVKLGQAASVKKRLTDYQTGDPHRAYKMLAWSDVMPEPFKAEKEMLNHFAPARVDPNPKCEWFRISEAQAMAYLNTLRRRPLTTLHAQTAAAEQEWYGDDPDGEET